MYLCSAFIRRTMTVCTRTNEFITTASCSCMERIHHIIQCTTLIHYNIASRILDVLSHTFVATRMPSKSMEDLCMVQIGATVEST